MASRIGAALARLPSDSRPTVAAHSRLVRAKETARVAADALGQQHPPGIRRFETLAALGEVDFGSGFEGASVEASKAGMYATYAAWAVGKIDARMDGGGESGREVLVRASQALYSLADLAKANGGTVLAVSHSTYLRTLLAAVGDLPLGQAASLEQKNGCINVLDIHTGGRVVERGPKSELLGGRLSLATTDFSLTLPETTIVRQNEIRHLAGITWPTV